MTLDTLRAEVVRMRAFVRAAETQATKILGMADSILSPRGIWLSRSEIMALPTSGPAWDALVSTAAKPYVPPDLSNKDSHADTDTLARALVYARTGDASMRDLVADAITALVMSPAYSGDALALARNLGAYVLAADLIALRAYDIVLDAAFRARLVEWRLAPTTGAAANLIDSHERRPSNWGTMAGAARIAIALYLDDQVDLGRAAKVFRGWCGERTAYAFAPGDFGGPFGQEDHSWEHDESAPVPVNPRGAVRDGINIDGLLPEEMRRGGTLSGGLDAWKAHAWSNYAWEALQGAVVQAALLHRAGYPAWTWGDHALLRAITRLHMPDIDFPAVGDDRWITHLANHHLGSSFAAEIPTTPGKLMGFTDWTHGRTT